LAFNISKDELDKIREILNYELLDHTFIIDLELKEIIKQEMPRLIHEIDKYNTRYGWRDCLAYILKDEFSINSPIISKKNNHYTVEEYYSNLCSIKKKIGTDKIRDFSERVQLDVPFGILFDKAVRINKKQFLQKEFIHFDVSKVDAVLSKICKKDYIALYDVEIFLDFPEIAVPWNRYVLESYLKSYSKKFKLINIRCSLKSYVGAMVKIDSFIKTYDDLLIEVLKDNGPFLDKEDALKFLTKKKYQLGKSYKNMQNIIDKIKRDNEVTTQQKTLRVINNINDKEKVENRRVSFKEWLRKDKKYIESTAQNYISTIANIDIYIKKEGKMDESIFNQTSIKELEKTIKYLLKDKEFVEYDEANSNSFRSALQKYLEFLSFEDVESIENLIDKEERKYIKEANEEEIYNNIKKRIIDILNREFINGIRVNSRITQEKIRKKYLEKYGKEIPKEIDIKKFIISKSVEFNGKHYIVLDENKEKIKGLIMRQIRRHIKIFYYKNLYDSEVKFFNEMHIFTEEVLSMYIQKIFPEFNYENKLFFKINQNVNLEKIIKDCFSDDKIQSYAQICEKLVYVPMNKIKDILVKNSDFIRVRKNEYISMKNIILDKNEISINKEKIDKDIKEKGFSSLAVLDVNKSMECNEDLSDYAIKNAFYERCLSFEYNKKGKIITPKGDSKNVSTLLEEYCLSHDILTRKQLSEYEEKLTANKQKQGLKAAYKCMIRVNKEEFVNKKLISFDTEKVDNALSLFAGNKIIPIRKVTSFTSFPYIEGYSWNLYLLESYCKLYSIKYDFECLYPNNENYGAIVPTDKKFTDYFDLLGFIIVREKISLTQEAIDHFLLDNGYIARSSKKINDIMSRAQTIMKIGG